MASKPLLYDWNGYIIIMKNKEELLEAFNQLSGKMRLSNIDFITFRLSISKAATTSISPGI